ncbi:hypothetical protein LINGRAHAP2_LOCUS23480 [Linum grandiflorum]
MAKSFALCFFLTFLLIISLDGMKMGVEADPCQQIWDCSGGSDRCDSDCKNKYNGNGYCDPTIAPFVHRTCVCVYPC